jgi:uncharacterized protein YktA (UPF0223 family)
MNANRMLTYKAYKIVVRKSEEKGLIENFMTS